MGKSNKKASHSEEPKEVQKIKSTIIRVSYLLREPSDGSPDPNGVWVSSASPFECGDWQARSYDSYEGINYGGQFYPYSVCPESAWAQIALYEEVVYPYAPKGKQGTKGQKQILQENVDTLAFYRNMILCTGALYLVCSTVLFSQLATLDMVLIGLAAVVYFACYQFMSSMSTPKCNADGSIIDEGCDLNIEGGIAEHVKDLIILTTACVTLSTISSYFWLLWLLAPVYAFRLLWKNILSPYFFQEAPPEPEVSDKKQRKMDRKMMRHR